MDVEELIETIKPQEIETNRYKLDEQYLLGKLEYSGNRAINENNYADEPTHNAYDEEATLQKFCINDTSIIFGNNGNGISWDDTINKVILYNRSGYKNNSTSLYGVGASKITTYSDGIPNFYGTMFDDKYYIRKFEWSNFPKDIITEENVKQITGVDIVEYEVSKEEYIKYIPSDFGFIPNYFINIHRYSDSTKNYNASAMINSLNSQMMNTRTKLETIIEVKTGSSKKQIKQSSKVFYPTLVEKNKQLLVPTDFSEIKKYNNQPIIIGNGLFDLYIYKTITSKDGNSDWIKLKDATNGGKNLLKIKGRGLNPRILWINHRSIQLIQSDYTSSEMGKYGKLLQGTIAIFKLRKGNFKFPTIKTENVFETYADEAKEHYVKYVMKDKQLQYNERKAEDAKVDEVVRLLTTTKSEEITTRNNLVASISYLTNETYTPSNIKDPNASQPRLSPKKDNLREYDLMIKNTNTDILDFQMEFQQGAFDVDHMDGVLARLVHGTSKYNAWVADSRGSLNKYVDWLRDTCLNVKLPEGTIQWAVLYEDLMNGNETKFIQIYKF